MITSAQAPFPRLEIYSPESTRPRIVFESSTDGKSLDGLHSYRFSTETDSLKGQFQFTVENSMRDDRAIFNRIEKKDVVKIYEGGRHPVFVGIIQKKRVAVSMADSGVKRSIQFSGTNILGILDDFILSMDLKLMKLRNAEIYSQQLTVNLAKNGGEKLKLREFLKTTLECYVDLNLANMDVSDTLMLKILRTHVCLDDNIFLLDDENAVFHYPIANAFYNQGQNRITEIWRNILSPQVYEMFPAMVDGKPRIKVREMPFDKEDWKNLDKKKIEPSSITDYDLSESDEVVYTFFNCIFDGSVLSPDQYTISHMIVNGGGPTITDKDKFSLYGFRPLEISFRGYSRRNNLDSENNTKMKEMVEELNKRACYWYSRLDEMLSGTLTIPTYFNEKNPEPGERLGLLEGEFYINKAEHSWNFGSTPKTNMAITRGMVYSRDGEQNKSMENVGMRLCELVGEK